MSTHQKLHSNSSNPFFLLLNGLDSLPFLPPNDSGSSSSLCFGLDWNYYAVTMTITMWIIQYNYTIQFNPIPWRRQQNAGVVGFAPSSRQHAHVQSSSLLHAEGEGSASTVSGPPYSGPAVKPILDSINYPQDMKGLDMRQLKQVRNVNKKE